MVEYLYYFPHSDDNNVDDESSDDDDDDDVWRRANTDNQVPVDPWQFAERSGPINAPPRAASPIAYYMLFLGGILQLLVDQTNLYAQQYVAANQDRPRHSRTHDWIPTTLMEMKGLIAVVLNMGIAKLPSLKSYWKKKGPLHHPWFRKMFCRNRFDLLLRFFHVKDNTTIPPRNSPHFDPTAKFEPLVTHCNAKFKEHYLPGEHVAIDESIIGTRGRLSIRQYLPNKRHARFGVKLWMLVDSASKYCMQFFVYRGKRYDPVPPEGQGFDVVTRLLRVCNLLNRAYHIVVDNFFTSVKLAEHLYEFGTYLTGTIRRNRDIPIAAKVARPAVGGVWYWKKANCLLTAFREKRSQTKPVLALSTKSRPAVVRGKPHMIRETYNPYMCGVDLHDMMLYTYHDERKQLKVWKKVVFNLFSRMLFNAYIIYKENVEGRPLSRLEFNLSVIDSLANDHLRGRATAAAPLAPQENVQAGVRKLPGRKEKECIICSRKHGNPRRRSRTVCSVCSEGLHLCCAARHRH